MVNQTGTIEVEIKAVADKKSFNDGINFARDTGVKIDKALRSKLTLDTIKAEDKIKSINKLLKTNIPTQQKIDLRVDLADTKRQLTETRRQLNNLANTGDVATSRLQRKFDWLGKGIRWFFRSFIWPAAIAWVVAWVKNLISGFDEANSTIIKATRATGDALKWLKNDFNATLWEVPQSANDVATAIGEINTRFGETGTGLQNLSKNFLDFARVTGTDVAWSIRLVSRLQKDFWLSNEEIPLLLDKITRAGQATGISVEKLSGITTQFWVQFRALWFSLDQSLALISKFEAEWVNTEAILAGLNKWVNELAKETWTSIPDAFKAFTDSIKNAGTESEALGIASDILWSRAWPQLALAVREGRLELNDFIGVLKDAEWTLNSTAEAALTAGEEFKIAFNWFIAAIQPALEWVTWFFTGFLNATTEFIGLFSSTTETTVTELDKINTALQQNWVQIQQLQQDYRDWKLSIEEYNEALDPLITTKEELTELSEAEATTVAALTEEYNKAQAQIDANNASIEKLTIAIWSNNFRVERWTLSAEEARLANQKLQAQIETLTTANISLADIQDAVTKWTDRVKTAMDKISTAKSIEEFRAYQLAALQTIKVNAQVLISALQAQKALWNTEWVARITEALQWLKKSAQEVAKIEFVSISGWWDIPDAIPIDTPTDRQRGGWGKSAATKAKEEELKAIEKLEKEALEEKERLAKEAEKIAKEEAKITEEAFKDAFDAIGDKIKDKEKDVADFTKQIEKSIDKIADIDAKIWELWASASEDLASRFVEVETELADPEIDQDKKKSLEEERALILANTTEEERAEAIRKEWLSDAEKILENRNLEIAALEEKRAAEQLALEEAIVWRDAALLQIEEIRATEQRLSEEAIAQTGKEFLEKAKSAQAYADLLDSLFGDTVTWPSTAWWIPPSAWAIWAWWGDTTITEWDINLDLNIEWVIDKKFVDFILEEAAKRIQDAKKTRWS